MFTPHDSSISLERIRHHVRRTPVQRSRIIEGGSGGGRVWLKLENHQVTGSFKIRGAYNKILSMDGSERLRGVVTASTGNHGAAVARAGSTTGTAVTVFVPENADRSKIGSIVDDGADVVHAGSDCVQSECAARAHARETGRSYISPYNDLDVVIGQSTIGVEIAEQVQDLDMIVASMGGGGLLGGVAGHLKSVNPRIRVVACSPRNSCIMHRSIETGRIIDEPSLPTLSDGTAGGVEKDSITFDLCRSNIDESVLVSEEEIAAAMRMLISREHLLVEGAAAAAVAGYLSIRDRYPELNVAIILCGCNVSQGVLGEVLS